MIHDARAFAAHAYAPSPAATIRQFMPLVRRLAWNIHGTGVAGLELDDLVQAGAVALLECCQRHDGANADGFAAYAKLRVRGAMIDLVRRTVPGARSASGARRTLAAARRDLTLRLGRPPEFAELADELRVSADDLHAMISGAEPLHFVDIADAADDDARFACAEPDAFAALSEAEQRAALTTAIAALPERHRLVIQLYFVEELSLAEIAAVLAVSVPRAHQLKAKAIELLQQAMARD